MLAFGDVLAEEDGEGAPGGAHPDAKAAQAMLFPHKVAGLPHVEMVKPAQTPGEGPDPARTPGAQEAKEPKGDTLAPLMQFVAILGPLPAHGRDRTVNTPYEDSFQAP